MLEKVKKLEKRSINVKMLVELIVEHIIHTQKSKAQLFKIRPDIVIIGPTMTFYYREM